MVQGTEAAVAPKQRSRIWLYLPFILLLVLAVAWSAGWFWIRDRAASEMDAWLAREAAAGRNWTCAERRILGFPFRLELQCSALGLARADGGFTLGPVSAVLQVYQPRHVLLQASGPFHAEQGDLVGDVNWARLQASFHGASDGFVRASVVVDTPKGRVTGGDPGPVDFSAEHLELHARPTPARFASEGAVDVSLRLAKGAFPQLDPLLGNTDPADISLDSTIARANVLRTGQVARELEKWRQADGRLEIAALSLVKGERRLQAKGEVGLDAAHRPDGQFEIKAAGLEGIIGQIMGQKLGAERGALIGNLVGQLLGGLQRREGPAAGGSDTAEALQSGAKPGQPPLKSLPSLKLAGGRLMLGPFTIPNVVLPVLY